MFYSRGDGSILVTFYFKWSNRLIWIKTHTLCGSKTPLASFRWLDFTFIIHLPARRAVICKTDVYYKCKEVCCSVFIWLKVCDRHEL